MPTGSWNIETMQPLWKVSIGRCPLAVPLPKININRAPTSPFLTWFFWRRANEKRHKKKKEKKENKSKNATKIIRRARKMQFHSLVNFYCRRFRVDPQLNSVLVFCFFVMVFWWFFSGLLPKTYRWWLRSLVCPWISSMLPPLALPEATPAPAPLAPQTGA